MISFSPIIGIRSSIVLSAPDNGNQEIMAPEDTSDQFTGLDPSAEYQDLTRPTNAALVRSGYPIRRIDYDRSNAADQIPLAVENRLLLERPEFLTTVAQWIFEEWACKTNKDLDFVTNALREYLSNNKIPLSIVAVQGDECVGSISLVENDLSSRPDLKPWVASLYVPNKWRSVGVGTYLLNGIIEVGKALGFDVLYLHTETASEFYIQRGWVWICDTINDRGEETYVFMLNIAH